MNLHSKLLTWLAASLLASSALSPSASAQDLGMWTFEEGTFAGGYGPTSLTVLDSSSQGNHGYLPDLLRRVEYTTDSHSGRWALDFNNPQDRRPYNGVIGVPHDPSLEPARGRIEAYVKISSYHKGTVFTKATFQFHRREPELVWFYTNGIPRIVGRGVYSLGFTEQGRLQGFVADDSLFAPGPWTFALSSNEMFLDEWNHVVMEWDGCEIKLSLNGISTAGVPYDAIPGFGLSYLGTGVDPTYGPVTLPASMGPFVGQLDDVRFSVPAPCLESLFGGLNGR